MVATLKTIESATAAWIEYRFLIIVYENTFTEWIGCDHAHEPRPGSGSQRHPCKKPATFRRPFRSPQAIRGGRQAEIALG